MFVKLANGAIEKFPYTLGELRRDNPGVSFPKNISKSTLASYAVFAVEQLEAPTYDPITQVLVRDSAPSKEVIRYKTEEDCTNPETGEVNISEVGKPLYGNKWVIGYTAENKPLDEAEAAVRQKRNELIAETDYMALVDHTITTAWKVYRQDLRDITDQEGFPFSVVWPTKPE